MDFSDILRTPARLLTQGSVRERVRRAPQTVDDPDIGYAALLYDPAGAELLADFHGSYIDIARRAGVPMLAMTSTWRLDTERHRRSRFAAHDVYRDHVRFLRNLAATAPGDAPVFVAGTLGPQGDAYDPRAGLPAREAETLHRVQAQALADAGADCLIALTLPTVSEALGLAAAMAATGRPYLLSFVVDEEGRVLDGTPLATAFEVIDQDLGRPPDGYLINCVHPRRVSRALADLPAGTRQRLIGIRANAANLGAAELDECPELISGDPDELARDIMSLARRLDLTILGGCCGTDARHLESLAHHLGAPP